MKNYFLVKCPIDEIEQVICLWLPTIHFDDIFSDGMQAPSDTELFTICLWLIKIFILAGKWCSNCPRCPKSGTKVSSPEVGALSPKRLDLGWVHWFVQLPTNPYNTTMGQYFTGRTLIPNTGGTRCAITLPGQPPHPLMREKKMFQKVGILQFWGYFY